MSSTPDRCDECDADWSDGQTCTDHFYTALFWEWEYGLLAVHHLLVLCFNLQHPRRYSPEALAAAGQMLVAFVEDGISPGAWRKQAHAAVDSGNRTYKITGTPDAQGSYTHPITWEMYSGDVIRAGVDHYEDSVRRWAARTLWSLRESGNLQSS